MNTSVNHAIAAFGLIFGGEDSAGSNASQKPHGSRLEPNSHRHSRMTNTRSYECELRALVAAELMDVSESWGGRAYSLRNPRPLDELDS